MTKPRSPHHTPAPPTHTSSRATHHPTALPHLLTADEVAELLRTTRGAIYAAVARGQLPGVVRIQRRVLFNRAELLSWLTKRQALSLEGNQR